MKLEGRSHILTYLNTSQCVWLLPLVMWFLTVDIFFPLKCSFFYYIILLPSFYFYVMFILLFPKLKKRGTIQGICLSNGISKFFQSLSPLVVQDNLHYPCLYWTMLWKCCTILLYYQVLVSFDVLHYSINSLLDTSLYFI